MNAQTMAEWYRKQGYSVIKTQSSYWYNKGPRVFQAFPWHWTIEPSKEELRELFIKHAAIGVRFSTPPEAPQGIISYHAICDWKSYDLHMLPRQSRQNVERGLAHCVVEPISFSRLAHEGWSLHVDTLKRQNRCDFDTKQQWEKSCDAARDLPGFEVWGALIGDKLAAALTLVRIDDWIVLLSQQCSAESLPHKPNHALTYAVTKEAITGTATKAIFYTLQSLDAPESVDTFKFRMGYRPIIVKQRVAFHPLLSPLIRQRTMGLLNRFSHRNPSSPLFAKAAGMVRICIDGKKPICEQQFPDVLKPMQAEFLQQDSRRAIGDEL
jgi:hypothetical protein